MPALCAICGNITISGNVFFPEGLLGYRCGIHDECLQKLTAAAKDRNDMQFNQANHNAGDVINTRLSPDQAASLAEKVAKMLFTAPDGEPVNRLRQANEPAIRDGRKMMSMDWAYVVENVRRILSEV